MKRKLLSIILVCAMMISVLGGCKSKKEDDPVTTDPSNDKATTAPADKEDDGDDSSAATDDKPEYSEITVEIFDRGTDGGKTDPTNNHYTNWIKEKALEELNIGITFVAVSRWEETDQLNNLMAAGTAPDVCLTYSGDLIANYRDLGGLTDLAPYIDSHLPDLKEFLGPDLALPGRDMIERNMIMETGEIFSIPARRMNVAQFNTFIRKDWLDKLGLPLPTTTQEFYDALVAFKTQDPGGVGKDKVVPFTMTTDVRWRAATLLNSFIDPNLSRKERWVNTVIDRNYLLPGYKEGVRFLNKMYNEGLVDNQFMLYNDDTDSDNLIKSGLVGAFIHNWDQAYRDTPGLLKDLLVNVPDAEIVTIDPFQNANGVTEKDIYDAAGVNFFVPASSENVEGALRYINWLSKFENRYYLQIGDEGVTHEMIDGVPKVIAAEGEKIMNSPQNIDYTIMINGLDIGDPDKYSQALAQSYTVDSQLIIDAYDNAMRNGRPAIIVPATLSAAGPYTQTLTDKGETLMAEAVTAAPEKFDEVWDAGIEDWLASGAAEIIAEREEKYIE
ncbi:extracellular solute-binding protein [Mobilitalea sibirica]|uniref:Extracellular solute-binding protein n=1 Tax=Mobilitalea sibirica TaxID=1462919 RepID=A0A8J7L1Z1_9FIRM|nr:extracellular solute-binding protein [Mobilitalea sibirica]MBH1939623.1 extracellular solute-binding protein [Mobilitalea sibirica]